ncbi:MFS transporter [Corynebacterium glutamicum]|uniref:MFS transporter n=1 Tax=Corynebacterium glutamicum TaxID=1718 RepID=UPI003B5B7736
MRNDRSFSVPIALLAAGALFLEILDGTILTTAVPAIARDFGIDAVDVSIALVAYLAAAAAGIPAAGWLADRFGVRKVLLLALAVFTAASLVCAVAPGLTVLTGARVIQGLGGALLVPVGRLAVIRGTDPKDLLDAIAFLTWPALVAPVIAPLLGGLIADTIGWRWIFLLNVPLGIVAIIAGLFILPKNTAVNVKRFDLPGFLGAMLVMVALTVAAELISRGSPAELTIAACLVLSAAVVCGFVVRWLRVPGRLFDLSIMRIPGFRVGNSSGSVYRLVITAAPFMFTLLFQVAFGWSATLAGAMVVALFAGNVAIKPFTTPIIKRWNFKPVLVFSNAAGALVLASFLFVRADTPLVLIVLLLFVSGALRSLGFSAYNTLQFVDIAPEQTSNANVLSATLHQLGMSLGIAVAVIAMSLAPTANWAFPLAAALFLIPLIGALSLPRDGGARAFSSS